MTLGRQTKKLVLVCTVLATLTCCLSPGLFLGSVTSFISSHIDNNDGQHPGNTSLPQRWGIRKTTAPSLRLLSELQPQTTAVVPHKSIPSEKNTNGIFAVFAARLPVPGLAYLNDISYRC